MGESRRQLSRRTFMGGAAATAGLLAALPTGMAQAVAEPRKRGRMDDIEHVVVLMQENRSFDHYYGTHARRPRIRRPDGVALCQWASTCSTSPIGAAGRRLPAAVPRRHHQGRRPGPRAATTTAGVAPTRSGTAAIGRLDRRQGRDHHVVLHREGRAVQPRARARLSPSATATSARSRGRRRRTGSSTGAARSTRTAPPVDRPGSTRTTTCPSITGRPTRNGCSRRASPGRCTRTTRWATAAARTAGSATTATTRCGCSRRITTRWPRPIRRCANWPTAPPAHSLETELGPGPQRRSRAGTVHRRLRRGDAARCVVDRRAVRVLRAPAGATGRRGGVHARRAQCAVGKP